MATRSVAAALVAAVQLAVLCASNFVVAAGIPTTAQSGAAAPQLDDRSGPGEDAPLMPPAPPPQDALVQIGAAADRPRSRHGRLRRSGAVRRANSAMRPLEVLRLDLEGNDSVRPSIVNTRPGAGGAADVILFGMVVKEVQIEPTAQGSFTADIVLMLNWNDRRASKLLPDGLSTITVSPEDARRSIWLPDICITNRQRGGLEVISSAITVTEDGMVNKTERVIAKLINPFDLTSYPFDKQTLHIRVASKTLMAKDVRLMPMQEAIPFAVHPESFDGTDMELTSANARVWEEHDGYLIKSRGEFNLEVKRRPEGYIRKKLLPQIFLVAISWTVFYFPLLPPFAMPRVATSLIAFLALMTLKSASHGGGWTDLVWENCVTLQFLTVMLNIFVELVNHTLQQGSIARRMDNELKVVLPTLAIVNFVILFSFTDGCYLFWVGWCTSVVSLAGPIAYICWCLWKFHKIKDAISQQIKKHADAASLSGKGSPDSSPRKAGATPPATPSSPSKVPSTAPQLQSPAAAAGQP